VPGIALAIYGAFFAIAFGGRTWLQYRRTGDHGFRGFSGRIGSVEWLGGVFLAVAALLTVYSFAQYLYRNRRLFYDRAQ